jgi:hypothetical protein
MEPFFIIAVIAALLVIAKSSPRPEPQIIYIEAAPQRDGMGCLPILVGVVLLALIIGAIL